MNITQGAEKIASVYSAIQGQEMETQIKTIAEDSDISVNILDQEGMRIFGINPSGRDYTTPMRNLPPPDMDDDEIFDHPENPENTPNFFRSIYDAVYERVRSSPSQVITIRFQDIRGRDMLLYGKIIQSPEGKEAILITSSTLQPLDETIAILSRQYIYVTVIMAVLAFIFSLIIASRVSKPIIRITDKARKLADGNFDLHFERGEYSEVNQLAETLDYAARGMQQAENMRNEFVANVSHDLRTPLTMIRVYAEMIRDIYRDDPDARDENVGIIIEESDRLTSLVQNILDLSRLQAGADTLHPQVFDLAETVRGIMKKFEALCAQQGFAIDFSLRESVMAFADEAKIELVLYNLLSNAVHYTGEDKMIHIAIADRGEKVRVLIQDTGEGIAPEHIEHIWDRYYKEGKAHKRATTGEGLGLAIVKSIMDLHGMDCGVDSVPGFGSAFWFELKKAL